MRKTVNGVVTNYTLHGKNIVHMTHGSNDLHFFYDAQNRPAIVAYNGAKYAYIYNLQGDVLGLIDNGIIPFEEMGELLEHREETDVVLTGTRMDDGLCRFADEIQEITDCPFCCFEGK